MATITPVLPNFTGATATPQTLTATDTIPVQPGSRYMMRTANTTATPLVTTIDDPNSVSPVGAQAYNPDIQVTTPITSGVRYTLINTDRHRDSVTGLVTLVNTGFAAGTTVEVVGPLP